MVCVCDAGGVCVGEWLRVFANAKCFPARTRTRKRTHVKFPMAGPGGVE